MALNINNTNGELVIDPYNNQEKYKKWNKKIDGLSARNNEAIVTYLEDMRRGINISPKATKGKRGFNRLNTQKHRLSRIFSMLEDHFKITDVLLIEADSIKKLKSSIMELFEKLEDGEIKKKNGKSFTSVVDYVKSFKAWWHWYMTYIHNEKSQNLPDICEYISANTDKKPQFVFFGEIGNLSVEEAFKRLINQANPFYRVLMSFLLDSGIRCPTELMNIKEKDISPMKDKSFFWLNIREETAKTFGRRIKLIFCHQLLKEYLAQKNLKPDDFVFQISPVSVNKYLKRLGERVLGKKGITMYDFRHNSACYWLPRYPSENALMYRFGWKNSRMIHYYTELMGMKDTIKEDDLLLDVAKAELQKELENGMKERELLQEQVGIQNKELAEIKVKLTQSESRDKLILKIIQGLAKKGKMKDLIEAVKEEGLTEELTQLG
jgi:integrase